MAIIIVFTYSILQLQHIAYAIIISSKGHAQFHHVQVEPCMSTNPLIMATRSLNYRICTPINILGKALLAVRYK